MLDLLLAFDYPLVLLVGVGQQIDDVTEYLLGLLLLSFFFELFQQLLFAFFQLIYQQEEVVQFFVHLAFAAVIFHVHILFKSILLYLCVLTHELYVRLHQR